MTFLRISRISSNGVLAIPARVIANVFMLTCFAGTIIVGIYNGNVWKSILLSAAAVAVVAWLIGRVIGALALHTVNVEIERHRTDNPIPDEFGSEQPMNESAADNAQAFGEAAPG